MSSGHNWLTARGFTNYRIEHKFGRDENVDTTFKPICIGGVWPTPTISNATPLRIKAGGNANDTAAGSGAREVTVIYLDTSLNKQEEQLATAGTSASSYTSGNVFRLIRAYVSASGTYASASSGFSHSASITLESSSEDWGTIDATNIARGQTQIGCYAVPATDNDGRTVKEAYVLGYVISADSNKQVDFIMYQRANAHTETSAPYTAARTIREHDVASGISFIEAEVPIGPFSPGTDLGWMAKAASSASAIVDFEILLVLED